jgi:hypothetical protein
MTETNAEPKPSDSITVIEAFDAMRIFLATVWRRQGKTSEDMALIVGGARLADGAPVDPAIWHDWLVAVHDCKAAQTTLPSVECG